MATRPLRHLHYFGGYFRGLIATLAILLAATGCGRAHHTSGGVLVLNGHGDINAIMADYIARGLDDAAADHAVAVVIELDTPGGLDSAMRRIVQRMNASSVPVIVYVSPPGARAASAGTFITEAAALAAMAPGTNIGAASPVAQGGADIPGVEGTKITNDAVAFIRSLAQQHGRNADWAESAVRKAASLSANEALDQHVIDLVAPDRATLLQQADGKTVPVSDQSVALHTRDVPQYREDKTTVDRILDLISDPNIAFLLVTLGGLALTFEVVHPTLFTGIFGVILLVTGLFALGTLPTNWAGLALVLLAFALFAADVYSGGVGILAAGGVTALILGGLLLVSGAGPGVEVSRWLVIGVALVIGLLFAGGISALYRTRRRPSVVGEHMLLGKQAVVRSELDPQGYVSIGGENWKARIDDGSAQPGERVTIVAVHGLELEVQRDGPLAAVAAQDRG